MATESKASDHVKPCNIAQSEAHNRRDTEYIKSLNPTKLYVRLDLSHNNASYVAPGMEGVSLQQHYDAIKVMVKQLTGRAMQEKDILLKNGKTRKGASPIRESVVNIKEDTTMEDLLRYVHAVEKKWGIHAIQIHIHKDEGHYTNPEDLDTWAPNYHAHIIWDWMDHSTGKSWKLNAKDMSDLQDMVAETLDMERGTSKAETGLEHLERNDFIFQKQKQELEKVEKARLSAEAQTANLEDQREQLEAEIENTKQRKAIAETVAKRLDSYAKVANIKEEELVAPSIDVHPAVKDANEKIQAELNIPIPTLGQKEWRNERKKAVKTILTDLQTELIRNVGLQKSEVTKLGKALYTKAMKEAAGLVAENKRLTNENIYLQTDNKYLQDKISKIDETAISALRREKDAEIAGWKQKCNQVVKDYNDLKIQSNSMNALIDWMYKHPDIVALVKNTQKKEAEERQLAEAKKTAMSALRDKCIANAQVEIQKFGKSGLNDYNDSEQISCVLCGIIAMADKLGINAAVEINSTKATKELLSGIKWINYREMQKNMSEWRTPQMVHALGGITKEMVSAFNDYLGGVQPVMSSGGSNGAAHSLTHWDGSEVTNGWRAPARPNFLNYSKKKGGGISM